MSRAARALLRGAAAGWDGLRHLLWPLCCPACGRPLHAAETLLCLPCGLALPWTGWHRAGGHRLERQFWGRLPVEGAWAAWTMARRGRVRRLLHEAKYRGRPELGRALGRAYGERLVRDGVLPAPGRPAAGRPDALVPVPMARSRERARGHNPARDIALGLAEASGLPVEEGWLHRREGRGSQTRMDRADRWAGLAAVYGPGPALSGERALAGRHLLLVDDVVTSGATLEACGRHLVAAGARLTVVALAHAD